ncbi:MAG: hypothetical protein ACRDRK_15215 [Pseudonocardia sp.]
MSWSGSPATANGQGDFAAAQVAYSAVCDSQNRRAARVVAGRSADAEDCAEMLAMLGLDAAEGRRAG